MGNTTNISWSDATWNIARGCTKVDEDCKFCYMYRDSMSNTRYDPLQVIRTKGVFNMPLRYDNANYPCPDCGQTFGQQYGNSKNTIDILNFPPIDLWKPKK